MLLYILNYGEFRKLDAWYKEAWIQGEIERTSEQKNTRDLATIPL